MSLSSRLTDALVRIGAEFRSVRSSIAAKYTKPAGGIPLSDMAVTTFPPSTHSHPDLTAAIAGKVNGTVTLWTGTVASLPTSKDPNTVYLAW